MIYIRSAIFYVVYFSWTIFITTLGFPIAIFSYRKVIYIAHVWSYGCMLIMKYICGLSWRIEGIENMIDGACIIASKHESTYDSMFVYRILWRPVAVIKKELCWVPWFGWFLIFAKMILIKRNSGASAIKQIIKESKKFIDDDRPVIIFPQGTRVKPGEKKPYLPGIASLYKTTNLTVVPVSVNTGNFWPKHAFCVQPGEVVIRILKPIKPGMDKKEFLKKLEHVIETNRPK